MAQYTITEEDLQECESCLKRTKIETMNQDDDSNWFCPECWEELAPIMKSEYDEMVKNGEIEKND